MKVKWLPVAWTSGIWFLAEAGNFLKVLDIGVSLTLNISFCNKKGGRPGQESTIPSLHISITVWDLPREGNIKLNQRNIVALSP
jgi:hypothetical protein